MLGTGLSTQLLLVFIHMNRCSNTIISGTFIVTIFPKQLSRILESLTLRGIMMTFSLEELLRPVHSLVLRRHCSHRDSYSPIDRTI